MKRTFLILTLIFLPLTAFGGEWVFIKEFEGRKHYIDSDSLETKDGFKWAKHKSEYDSVRKGEDYKNKSTYSYITTNSLLAFNCNDRTLIPINTSYFNGEGSKVHEIEFTTVKKVTEGDRQWELDDNPQTFRSSIIEYICK